MKKENSLAEAIITANTEGVGTEDIKEAYDALRQLLVKRYGRESDVWVDIRRLEQRPELSSRQLAIYEAELSYLDDPQLTTATQTLCRWLGLGADELENRGMGRTAGGTGEIHVGDGATAGIVANEANVNEVHIHTNSDNRGPDAQVYEAYRQHLLKSNRYLPLRSLDMSAGDPASQHDQMELAQVYISLDTTSSVESPMEGKMNAGVEQGESRPLSARDAVGRNRCCVLLGNPGSGKSTFVHHFIHSLTVKGVRFIFYFFSVCRVHGWINEHQVYGPVLP